MSGVYSINDLLPDEITKFDHNLIPPGYHDDVRSINNAQAMIGRALDLLGEQSALTQGLNKVITTTDKLRNSPDHILYLLKDANSNEGRGRVIGMLKVGYKKLYLFDDKARACQVEPLCVLDFYVRSERQRCGFGKALFDYMLEDQGVTVEQLAIDGPSPKMEQFLRKNYGIEQLVRQSNNFAVAPQFFIACNIASMSGRNSPVSASQRVGRYTAHKPESHIGSLIHGPTTYAGESDSSDTDADPQPRHKDPEKAPELKAELVAPSPERPTTLQVETLRAALKANQQPPEIRAAGSDPVGDSEVTEQGFFNLRSYHNKLW